MRAHYKRSKHQITVAWFRLWLSPAFERATCVPTPEISDPDGWSRQWTNPATPDVARTAMNLCLESCPVLTECRALVSLGEVPRGVVQAGKAYGLRVGGKRKKVTSGTTDDMTTDEDEAC